MARPLGSKNKTSLNLTEMWRGMYTEADLKLAYTRTIEALQSDDPTRQQWAVEFIAKRFTISQDKLGEIVAEQLTIETKEQFEAMLKELQNGHSAS